MSSVTEDGTMCWLNILARTQCMSVLPLYFHTKYGGPFPILVSAYTRAARRRRASVGRRGTEPNAEAGGAGCGVSGMGLSEGAHALGKVS